MEDQYNKNENNTEAKLAGFTAVSSENVFLTPDNYFEKLPVTLADRIHHGNHQLPVKYRVSARLFTLAGAAFVAVIIGAFYVAGLKTENPIDSILSYDEVMSSGVVAEMDETMLFEELNSRVPTDAEAVRNDNLEENEHVKEYLIESNTDITLIINEL